MNGSRRLLLVSSSRTHGTGYLEHCGDAVAELFAGVGAIVFVPYALADHAGYASAVRRRFAELSIDVRSLHEASDPAAAVAAADGVFIGGGNTFRLLDTLYRLDLVDPLRARVREGMPYLGTSAGSNVAGATIRTTNDMPIVEPPTFEALHLVDFQINPHYLDPEPESTHQGETRDQRLREFHEENDAPVVALREGAWLRIVGPTVTVEGETGGKLFLPGQPPLECPPGTELSPGPLSGAGAPANS